MRPSGIQFRFLLPFLVNGCLFYQSGFQVFPDFHNHTLDVTSPSIATHLPFMSPFFSVAFRRDNTPESLALTIRQGKVSAGSLKSEWTDRYAYCTPQEV